MKEASSADLLASFNGSGSNDPDGTISKDIMPDFLHPSAKGYAIWAESLKPLLP